MQFLLISCDTGEPVLIETSGSTDVLKVQQNYPNPFNGSTTIRFELFSDAYATVKVYNKPGQVIKTLADNKLLTTGVYEYHFDGRTLSSGKYLFVVSAEIQGKKYSQVKEMLLVK
jgi:flagellar hook assembly protein FlgD